MTDFSSIRGRNSAKENKKKGAGKMELPLHRGGAIMNAERLIRMSVQEMEAGDLGRKRPNCNDNKRCLP